MKRTLTKQEEIGGGDQGTCKRPRIDNGLLGQLCVELVEMVLARVAVDWRCFLRSTCRLWRDLLDDIAQHEARHYREQASPRDRHYDLIMLRNMLCSRWDSCCKRAPYGQSDWAHVTMRRRGCIIMASTMRDWYVGRASTPTPLTAWTWLTHCCFHLCATAENARETANAIHDPTLIAFVKNHVPPTDKALEWALQLCGTHKACTASALQARASLIRQIVDANPGETDANEDALSTLMASMSASVTTLYECTRWVMCFGNIALFRLLVRGGFVFGERDVIISPSCAESIWEIAADCHNPCLLACLLDTIKDPSVSLETRDGLSKQWDEQSASCVQRMIATGECPDRTVLEAIGSGITFGFYKLAHHACQHNNPEALVLALECANDRGLLADPTHQPHSGFTFYTMAKLVVCMEPCHRPRNPKAMLRFLCDLESLAIFAGRDLPQPLRPQRIGRLVHHARKTPNGGAACALFLFRRWPEATIASMGGDARYCLRVLVREALGQGLLTDVCSDCCDRHKRGLFVNTVLERVVHILDACVPHVMPPPPITACTSSVDSDTGVVVNLWAILVAILDNVDGPIRDLNDGTGEHYNLPAALCYAYARATGASLDLADQMVWQKRAPDTLWKRWCKPFAVARTRFDAYLAGTDDDKRWMAWLTAQGLVSRAQAD